MFKSIVTLAGRAKIAAAIAGVAPLNIAALAVGDGNGIPITPLETMTALVHEVWRGGVTNVVRDPQHPSQVIVSATIPAEAGPFFVRELALYDAAGSCIAIMSYPQTEKPATSQNVVTTLDIQFVFVVDTAASVTVQIDPATLISIAGMLRPPFIGVDSFATAPPLAPAAGALVVVAPEPTGAFVQQANKLAQWNGRVWQIADAPLRTVVGNAEDGRYYERIAGGWREWSATDTLAGLTTLNATRQQLGVLVPLLSLPYPEVFTPSKMIGIAGAEVAGSGGELTVAGGEKIRIGQVSAEDASAGFPVVVTVPGAAFGLAPNSTYFLRGTVQGDGTLLVYVGQGTDDDQIPGGLVGAQNAPAGQGFDSSQIDVLFARVVTGAAGSSPVITPLANAAMLSLSSYRQSPIMGQSPTTWVAGRESIEVTGSAAIIATLSWRLDWARRPTTLSYSMYAWVGTAATEQFVAGGAGQQFPLAGGRYYQDVRVISDWVQVNAFSGGVLQWIAWWAGGSLSAQA